MKLRMMLIALCLVMMISLTGCSNGNNEDTKSEETRVVSTDRGDVEIPANPERIADLSGMSDVLYILGHKPVATSDADAYNLSEYSPFLKDELEGATIVGYSMSETVDIEGVIASEPDLIIINYRQEAVYDQLSEIATTIVVTPDVNDWRTNIRMMAGILGEENKAEEFIKDYEMKATGVGEEIRKINGEDATYFSFLTGEGSYYLFTGAAFGDIFYNDLGLAIPKNLPEQDSITLPVTDLEGLTEIESDYILILASDEHRASLEESSVFNSIEAVKAGNVIWVTQSPYFNQAYSSYGKYKLLDELQTLLCK